MKTLIRSLALLALIAAPVQAQSLADIRTELVRSRGFIRGAETQLSKTLTLLDSLMAIIDTMTVPAPDTATAPPPVDTTTTPPPSTGFEANRPAGLTTVLDESFAAAHSGGSGRVGSITVTDWNRLPGDECRTITDPTSPTGRAWESVYSAGPGGGGPCALDISLGGTRSVVYVSMWTKYSAGWQRNGNSQKVIYWNTTAGNHAYLTGYTYGNEAVDYVRSATGCEYLEANRAGTGASGNSSPCNGQQSTRITAGQWDHWEYLMDRTTGTVKWWKNGALRGEHIGRSLSPFTGFQLPDTWGGGGNLTTVQNRRYARILVAAGSN